MLNRTAPVNLAAPSRKSSRVDWPRVAEAVASLVPRARLHPAVVSWTTAQAKSRACWHVALSGGADSVALLLLLWAHWPQRRGRLRALHFDHRLRGADSRRDAIFCRELCKALGVPIEVGVWKRPRGRERPSEAEARAARMAFFGRHARVLWLGHHQDDVAETMLMRLARGSGAAGLSAPRPVQPLAAGRLHLRPLLALRREHIRQVLTQAGASWREDATNAGGDYFRNRVRRDVIPAWVRAAQREAVAGAGLSRELLAEDDVALEAWVDAISPISKSGELRLERLAGKPSAVVRRSLRRWLAGCRPPVDVSRQAFDALLAAVEAGRPTRHSLASERFAVIRAGRLRMAAGNPRRVFQRRVN